MSTHSKKRNQLTFFLCCALLLLLAAIAWLEIGNKPVVAQPLDSISSVTIKRNGHADIILSKQNEQWKIESPYSLEANEQRIKPLLQLGIAHFDGYELDQVDLPATGLSSPNASVIVGMREFQLGNTDAEGNRRYALVDNKVSFVPEWVWSLIHGGVTAFADPIALEALPNKPD